MIIAPWILLTVILGADETQSAANAPPLIGGHEYVALDTRQATLDRMLDLLIPSKGRWGRFHLLSPFPFSGARALGNGEIYQPLPPEDELANMKAGGKGPDLSRVYSGKAGRQVRWVELSPEQSEPGRKIELRVFDDAALNEDAVCYLYVAVECDEAISPVIPLGSDDGILIWLNGRLIHENDVPRGLDPYSDSVRFPFVKGTNHVLFKVSQGGGSWEMQINPRERLNAELDALLYYYVDRDFPLNRERQHYQVLTYPIPDDVALEVGGLSFLSDGRPVVSTRRGDVYVVDGAYQVPPTQTVFKPFARGLHEVLGTLVRRDADGDGVYTVQRGELTRLLDLDGDDRADRFETYCDAWGISGNYHEFAFGPEFDDQGNAWVTLNVGFCGSLGKAAVPNRGSCIKVAPDGSITTVCDGVRSPNGIGRFDGEFFYVDNQGDYVATNKLSHLKQGSWHGHPASLRWREGLKDGERPPRQPPAVWFPYARMGQSVADIETDTTGGKFGPFAGQLFCGDQLSAIVMRVSLEQVEGHYQGACYPFLEGLACGVNRLRFATDGSLFVGETDRGWGSVGRKRYGLERVVYTGKTPFEMHEVRALEDGFRVTFTADIAGDVAGRPASYRIKSHTYDYHSDYGAPEIDFADHAVTEVIVEGPRSVRLKVDGLRAGYVFEIDASGVRAASGETLLHDLAWYTLINIPGRPPFDATPSLDTKRVLFLSHSAGFTHDPVKRPRPHILSLAEETLVEAARGRFLVDPTQDCGALTKDTLKNYDAVVFYTTGELPISTESRDALFDWIVGGGAFVGIHSATDTYYEVPQYMDMIGGTFDGHPWNQEVTVIVEDPTHPATAPLGESFVIADEIYQHRGFQRHPLNVLMRLDPASIDIDKGKRADHDYALAWCKDYGEGRVFYTALGHRPDVWKDARFRKHVAGALQWAMFGPDYQARPPQDATVLYSGGAPTAWRHLDGRDAEWLPVDEAMEIKPGSGDVVTREEFSDFLLHVEFMTPASPASQRGQARGNSGVYVLGRYEVQVLDSYGVEPGMGDCGAIYSKRIPDRNVSRPPERWQTYDIRFRAPRFDDAGAKTENARISVWHNGYPIHRDFELDGPTGAAAVRGEGARGPIQLQDHGNGVRYRNIWIAPLR